MPKRGHTEGPANCSWKTRAASLKAWRKTPGCFHPAIFSQASTHRVNRLSQCLLYSMRSGPPRHPTSKLQSPLAMACHFVRVPGRFKQESSGKHQNESTKLITSDVCRRKGSLISGNARMQEMNLCFDFTPVCPAQQCENIAPPFFIALE